MMAITSVFLANHMPFQSGSFHACVELHYDIEMLDTLLIYS